MNFFYILLTPRESTSWSLPKYSDTKQTPEQSVRDFATYLAQCEPQLPEPYTERQRKEYLRTLEDSMSHRHSTICAEQNRKPPHYQKVLKTIPQSQSSSLPIQVPFYNAHTATDGGTWRMIVIKSTTTLTRERTRSRKTQWFAPLSRWEWTWAAKPRSTISIC